LSNCMISTNLFDDSTHQAINNSYQQWR